MGGGGRLWQRRDPGLPPPPHLAQHPAMAPHHRFGAQGYGPRSFLQRPTAAPSHYHAHGPTQGRNGQEDTVLLGKEGRKMGVGGRALWGGLERAPEGMGGGVSSIPSGHCRKLPPDPAIRGLQLQSGFSE